MIHFQHGSYLDPVNLNPEAKYFYLERDKVSPDAGLVGRLDLVVKVVQDDVVDVLVPGQDLGYLTEPALTNLHPEIK